MHTVLIEFDIAETLSFCIMETSRNSTFPATGDSPESMILYSRKSLQFVCFSVPSYRIPPSSYCTIERTHTPSLSAGPILDDIPFILPYLVLLSTFISIILNVSRSKVALPCLKFGARPHKMYLFYDKVFSLSVGGKTIHFTESANSFVKKVAIQF